MDLPSPEIAVTSRTREGWRRAWRRRRLHLTLGALALLAGAPVQAQKSGSPNVIVGAALRAIPGGAALDLTGREPLRWTAGTMAPGTYVLELVDARPGEGLSDLQAATGIVAGVTFETERAGGRPSTRVIVETRGAASYGIGGEDRLLSLEFRPQAAAPELAPAEPAAAAPTAPGSPSAAAEPSDYEIGPGDVVSVSVFGVEELDRKTRVQTDGTIALPLLGRVRIVDLTVGQAEQEIGRELRERQLVSQPQVLVVVEEYASYGVTVQGGVVRPGVYPVIGRQSLLEVIWAAGGLAESTVTDQKILVLREDAAGRTERIEVDAYRLLDEGDASLNLALRPGDRVVVPKPQRFKVYVSGAVRRPGPVEFGSSSGLTVLQAIILAGGPTERANLGKVTVIRQGEDGTQETIKVNVKKIQRGKAQDVFLENNDTVQVGVWFF